MFESIIKHLDDGLALDEREVSAPVTFDVGGKIVTVRELVDLELEMGALGRSLHFVDAAHPVGADDTGIASERLPRAVNDLGGEEVRELVIETIRSLPDDLAIGSMAGEVDPAELERDVREGTVRGERFVQAVRDEALFMQEALQAGKVVIRPSGRTEAARPAFDF